MHVCFPEFVIFRYRFEHAHSLVALIVAVNTEPKLLPGAAQSHSLRQIYCYFKKTTFKRPPLIVFPELVILVITTNTRAVY